MSYPFNEAKHTVCYAAVVHRAGHSDPLGWKREEFDSAVEAEARMDVLRGERQESISLMTPADAAEWNAISFTRLPENGDGAQK